MMHSSEYPVWRRAAAAELQAKNVKLEATFKLDNCPHFEFDAEARSLVFFDDTGPKVRAQIEIAGTTSTATGSWVWAWANPSWPDCSIQMSLLAKKLGDLHAIEELTQGRIPAREEDLNQLGWSLSAVIAKLADADGVFCPQTRQANIDYLLLKEVLWTRETKTERPRQT